MDQEKKTAPSLPSVTGLHVFAKREGLWENLAKALQEGPEATSAAVKSLLTAYHQTHLNLPLAEATALVDRIPPLALDYYAQAFPEFVETPMPTPAPQGHTAAGVPNSIRRIWEALVGHQRIKAGDLVTDGKVVTLHGAPVFRFENGMVSASWAGRATLTTAAIVNGLASLAGLGRPFKVGLDGQVMCQDQACDPAGWVDLGAGPAHSGTLATASLKTASMGDITPAEWADMTDRGTTRDSLERGGEGGDAFRERMGLPPRPKTAASYPQAVKEKGGDPGKVRQALEKAVKALNEANVNALKFDDRLAKLERDTYAIFGEYLNHTQQEDAVAAREKAQEQGGQPVTSALKTADGVINVHSTRVPTERDMMRDNNIKRCVRSGAHDWYYSPNGFPEPRTDFRCHCCGWLGVAVDAQGHDIVPKWDGQGQPIRNPDFEHATLKDVSAFPPGYGRQASLSTPATDEEAGEHDSGDMGEGESITAAAAPTDEEILKAAKTLSLNDAREAYTNGRMSQDLFDAFVPLWEALHQQNGPAELQAALDRGDIDQHVFDLGQQLLAESRA